MWRLLQRCVKAGVYSSHELFQTEKTTVGFFSLRDAVFVSGVSHAGERIGICFC